MERVAAWLYDGRSARRHAVAVGWDGGDALEIADDAGAPVDSVALADLAWADAGDTGPVYRHARVDGWRIGLVDPPSPALAAALPRRTDYGRVVDRHGLWPAALAFAAASAAVLAVGFAAPQWIAPLVPQSWERQLGNAMVGDFGGRFCHTRVGDAALAKLAENVDPGGVGRRVEVAAIPIVNAIALPGGTVVVFDELVQDTDTPDALAGVVAHEVGHVRRRHVMQAMLRQFGLSLLFGGLSGDIGGTVGGVAAMTYSRDAEREADDWSRARLQAANISPLPTARFFARLAKDSGEDADETTSRVFGYLASHPLSRERRKAFAASAVKGHAYRSALTNAEWQAIRTMCADDPDVRRWEPFDGF